MLHMYHRMANITDGQNAPSGRPAQLAALFQGAFSPSKVSLPHDLRHIVIIATARDRTEVHPSILSSHLITEVANMGGLNKDARREVSLCVVHGNNN